VACPRAGSGEVQAVPTARSKSQKQERVAILRERTGVGFQGGSG
jgi:hypothetical protein